MMKNESGTLEGTDIESLHVMRVSCRRLRVALSVFGDFFDPPISKDLREALRRTGKVLGEIRDLDVLIQCIEGDLLINTKDGKHIFQAFWNFCQEKRQALRVGLSFYFQSPEYMFCQSFLYKFCERIIPSAQSLIVLSGIETFANNAISKKRSDIPSYDDLPSIPDINRLHQLRIAIKKLRYTAEFFEDLYRENLSDLISQLKIYQDHLGIIHDYHFRLQQARTFLDTSNYPEQADSDRELETINFAQYIQREERRMKEMMSAFYTLFKSNSFGSDWTIN